MRAKPADVVAPTLLPPWRSSAKDLLRQLDPETLAELAQLLAGGRGKGDASN